MKFKKILSVVMSLLFIFPSIPKAYARIYHVTYSDDTNYFFIEKKEEVDYVIGVLNTILEKNDEKLMSNWATTILGIAGLLTGVAIASYGIYRQSNTSENSDNNIDSKSGYIGCIIGTGVFLCSCIPEVMNYCKKKSSIYNTEILKQLIQDLSNSKNKSWEYTDMIGRNLCYQYVCVLRPSTHDSKVCSCHNLSDVFRDPTRMGHEKFFESFNRSITRGCLNKPHFVDEKFIDYIGGVIDDFI